MLLAGCAVGLCISLAAHLLGHPFQQPASITLTVRAAFVPVVADVAFLASGPHRALAASLPAPTWLITAAHLLIALPLLVLTAWIQLSLGAADLSAALRFQGAAAAPLPWTALGSELAAWLAVALAAAALVARTRWSDLGGAIAAPAALAFLALLALAPAHLFPTAFTAESRSQHSAWLHAEWGWWALGVIAALVLGWASRDPWLRLRLTRARVS